MITDNRKLLQDVTRAYSQARERYTQAQYRGDVERADEALTRMQTIEDCIAVTERSRVWRG